MDRQLSEWKLSLDRIWSAAAPDYHEAARLAAEIASAAKEATLRWAAAQALPILRSAAQEDADQATQEAALRRLGVVREVLHTLTTPNSASATPSRDCRRQRSVTERCWDCRSIAA